MMDVLKLHNTTPASTKIKIMGLPILYLIGSITFIWRIKMLSDPASARKGNLLAATGMIIAILGTIFLYQDDEGKKLERICLDFRGNSHRNRVWER